MAEKVIIEKNTDGAFFVYLKSDETGANGVGSSISEAKASFMECIDLVIEDLQAEGEEIPLCLLQREFIYQYDIASFLENFSWINVSALARRIGISPSLMRQYKSRTNFASEKQLRKIQEAVKDMARELEEACLI